MAISDIYRLLFGRDGTEKGTDIDMSEHGRVGGVSSGQPFKHVSVIDSTTGANLYDTLNIGNAYLGGIAGLVPSAFDYISLSYTGSNLTGVVYKLGGSGGTTVATLTIAYSGSNITSVTKT